MPDNSCPTCGQPVPTDDPVEAYKRMKPAVVAELSITDMPELLSMARREVAQILTDYADEHGNPAFAQELRELAAIFEAGQFEE